MTAVLSVNTWDELEGAVAKFGPLVSVGVAAVGLGVSTKRVYQLGDTGKLTFVCIMGVYHVPASEVVGRRGALTIREVCRPASEDKYHRPLTTVGA